MKPATIAIPFTPTPDSLPTNWPDDLAFATRTIDLNGSQLQYLVYQKGYSAINDPRLNHVIGSGFSVSHACLSASMWLELDAKKPSDFWPRLQGCSFKKVVEPGNVALQHVCLDAKGEEIARADYRNESARLALHHVLVNCSDMTFDEFLAISVVARTQIATGRTYGLVYADDCGQDAVNRLLVNAFKNNASTRDAALAEFEKRTQKITQAAQSATSKPPKKQKYAHKDTSPLSQADQEKQGALRALQQSVAKILLSSGDKTGTLTIHKYITQDNKWTGNIILCDANCSESNAMKIAYSQYQEEIKNQLEQDDSEAGEYKDIQQC